MRGQEKKIAVVVPAYNEGSVIRKVVAELKSVLEKTSYKFQIIVVDDGSKDNTASEARSGGAYVIQQILNTGSGGATATGLSYASQNDFYIAATCDGDGQHDANDVVKGIDLLIKSNVDLLIGSRLINKEGMSRVKVIGNQGLSFITKILFGINITDSQSGLRIFSRRALESLKWKTSGYEFCSEMLWRAKQLGLKIDEYSIKAIYTDYSKTKGQNNWNGINIIKSLIRRRIVEMFE